MANTKGIKTAKRKAFTMVEVLITLAVLSVAMVAILKSNVVNLRSGKKASELNRAVVAAEYLIKQEINKGYPTSGIFQGSFKEGEFGGLSWYKKIEPVRVPLLEELKLVTVSIKYGEGKKYTLQTVLSKY
ncbi:MAG: type IV pilus modification PilV family protein [Spirochaetota bacterium]